MGKALGRHLARLVKLDGEELRAARDHKFNSMGNAFVTDTAADLRRPATVAAVRRTTPAAPPETLRR